MGPSRRAKRAPAGRLDLQEVSALRCTEGRCAAGDRAPPWAETPAPRCEAVAFTSRARPAAFGSVVRA
eukprot:3414761-Heterocapsa_arctica.AAC.1